ncbi:peptidylprolyl isomerase [bacterium]|nr:peptidylprolyl isomerase [bacterium]
MKNSTKAAYGLALALLIGGVTASCSALTFNKDGYVATVNGHKVSLKDYNQALEQQKKQYAMRFGVDFNSTQGKQMLAGMQQQLLQQLTERELLLIETEKRGLKATDAEVETKLADVKKQFPDNAAFEKAIKEYGLTLADLKQQLFKAVAIEKLQKDVGKDIAVTDAQVADYYNKNKAQFAHTEEVEASHILVKFDEEAKDKAKDEARALGKIKEIHAKVKAGGDFAKLAGENSDDPGSKAQGGSLGFFGKGRMVPEFEKTAFAMKNGEVSEPFKTQFGYHIIKRLDYRPARTEPLAEVSKSIHEQLQTQQQGERFQQFVETLKKGATIEIRPEYQPKHESPAPSAAPVTPEKK